MRTCTKCGKSKRISEFYTKGKDAKARFTNCKTCMDDYAKEWRAKNKDRTRQVQGKWGKTINGYRQRMWQSMKQRIADDEWYGNKLLKMTKDEWYEFATPELEAFFCNYAGRIPSVDRIEPKGDYEIGNIRIIPLEDNIARSMTLLRWFKVDKTSPTDKKVDVIKQLIKGQCEAIDLNINTLLQHLNETIS